MKSVISIKICSRKAAEKLLRGQFPEGTAVISFYNPPCTYESSTPCSHVDYAGKAERIFQIALDDFQTSLPEAADLAKFIDTAISDGLNIICQCESGQNRSVGCAAAILEHYCDRGQSVFDSDKYRPDEMVYYSVLDALEKRGRGRVKKH